MSETVPLEIVHAVPGRLRLRLLDGEDCGLLTALQAEWKALPGVTEVSTNALTRSILLRYNPGALEPARELGIARPAETRSTASAEDEVHARAVRTPGTPAARAIGRAFWDADRQLAYITDGKVDLKLAIPAVLLGAGLWELFTGAEIAAATFHTLTWYAYNIFIQLHPKEVLLQDQPATPL